MDIAETKSHIVTLIILDRSNNGIHIFNLEARNLPIYRSLGLAALVADHTTSRISQASNYIRHGIAVFVELKAGEAYTVQLEGRDRIMARNTLYALCILRGDSGINLVGFRAIRAQVIAITSSGMASGAGNRHFSGVISI